MRKAIIIGAVAVILVVKSLITPAVVIAATNSFFEQEEQYRGFYWFEDNGQSASLKKKETASFANLSPSVAAKNIASRREQLDQARDVMIELAFQGAPRGELYKAVAYYKKLENQMRGSAVSLAAGWEMVNFIEPGLVDFANNPVNVPANKLKRKQAGEEQEEKIKAFARSFDLVLFEQDACPYCLAFRPIIERFSKDYGFSLELAGTGLKARALIQKLSIEAAPTLVAIAKDGSKAFELARGLVTLSELGDNVMFASELVAMDYQFNQHDKGE